jgi:hypothetical protein
VESAIPYCGDLHIDAATKKLILNLLGSIRSVVPVAGPPEPRNPEDPGELKSPEEIRGLVRKARQHSDELADIFDPELLCRYLGYVSDYQEIINQLELVQQELRMCSKSAMNFAAGMAELLEDHLQLTSSGDENGSTEPGEVKLKVV